MINILVVGMMDVKGGIEQLVYQVCAHIDKSRFHCDFLSYCPKCAYEDELKALGGKVYHITRRGENPIKCRKELKAFYKTKRNVYDYIWIHGSSSSNCTGHIFARKYTNAQIISHSHGIFFESKGKIKTLIHTFLHRLNHKKFMRCTDYCFACSRAAGKWLFGNTEKTIHVIKNGITIDKYEFNPVVREEYRKNLALGDSTVIANAGRFCSVKNQEFVLDIFNELIKQDNSYKLLFAGEGELLQNMKQKAADLGISDRVLFLGYRNDLNCILQAVDVLLLPSLYEGFPMVTVEAQASGLPCLLSDTITDEVQITDLVEYKSLSEPAQKWSEEIIRIIQKHTGGNRAEYVKEILENGYDIQQTVRTLEIFFAEHAKLN